jgi:acetoin utilization protein AcuB
MNMSAQIELAIDEFTSPCENPVAPNTPLTEIVKMLDSESYRHVPVVDGDKPVGIISSRDLKFITRLDVANLELSAADFMTEDPFTVVVGTPIQDVALEMSKQKIGSAIVTDQDGKIEGIFTTTDALNALVEVLRGEY